MPACHLGTPRQDDTGNAFLDMLSVFAEFETNLRRVRQLEGIKAEGAGHLQGTQADH